MTVGQSPEQEAARLARWELIQTLWNEGTPSSVIREQLGWSEGQLGNQISRMRDAGWDRPYRYDKRRRAKMRAGRKHGRPRGR